MVQAVLDVTLSFAHIAGVNNGVADALSRAHLTDADYKRAAQHIKNDNLNVVDPCIYVMSLFNSTTVSRRGVQLAGDGGIGEAAGVQGTGDESKPQRGGQAVGGIRMAVRHGRGADDTCGHLPIGGVLGGQRCYPRDGEKPAVARASACAAGWRVAGRVSTPPSGHGGGRLGQEEGLQIGSQRRHSPGALQKGAPPATGHPGGTGAESGVSPHVPGRNAPIRGGATISEQVRPEPALNERRYRAEGRCDNKTEVGEKLTKVQSGTQYYIAPQRRYGHLPRKGCKGGVGDPPVFPRRRPFPPISKNCTPSVDRLFEGGIGHGSQESGGGPRPIYDAQYKEGVSYKRLLPGLPRVGGTKTWRLGFPGSQDVYRHFNIKEGPEGLSRDSRAQIKRCI